MILFTIQYMNSLLLLLSLALILPARAASTGSVIARSSRNKISAGFRILPDELTPDFFKRQTVCPATTPLCGTDCCATTCCSGTCCSEGTTCTAGVCTSTAPPPATTVVLPSASPSDSSSSSAFSTIQSPSSSSSTPVVSPPPTDPSSSSSSSQSDALISPSSSQSDSLMQTPSPSGSSQSDSSTQSSSSSSSQTPSPSGSSSVSSPGGSGGSNSTLPAPSESIGNGTTSTSLSSAVVTGGSTITGGSMTLSLQPIPLGNLSQNDTSLPSSSNSVSSSTSYALSYEFATVTGPGGSESISIGTVAVSQAVVPVSTDPAIAAAPLVVQQASADAPPTPVCQLQYLPGDAWQTTGGPADNTTSTNGPTQQQWPAVVPQCNNGTRVSNIVGSEINLKFTGTEVSLLMVPGAMGGAYDIKLDDGDVETLDNYKAGVTSCVVAAPWSRTGLENKPHDITVIVKGSPAGSAGGSQIEFNGLVFKGPQPNPDSSSGPNWIIIGASIGAGVVVLALIFVGFLCIRRRRAQRAAPTPAPRPPSAVSSFRPQTVVSDHTRAGSAFSGAGAGAAQASPGHHRADSNFSNAPSGHYRGDSGFSGAPYSPSSPLSQLQQNPYGHSRQQSDAQNPFGHSRQQSDAQNPFGHSRQQSDAQNPFGHSRQQSDAPLMMQQGQQTPWQIPVTGMANAPPSGSPYHSNMSSPQSRPLTFVGYNNGQERQSMAGNAQERQPFVQTHDRTTSYGSDIRNPFE